MFNRDQFLQILPKLKIILIIHLALALGILFFAGVMALVADWSRLATEASVLALMAAIVGLMIFGMSFIIPKILNYSAATVAAMLTKKHDLTEISDQTILQVLLGNYTTSRIIAAALMEAGIFLNLIVFMIEPNTVSIAVFVIGILLFVFRTPLLGRQLNRLENDVSDVRRELQLFR
jgi:NADH:ubiquinone oxidoreductase subunit 6 (subunit J)